MISAELSPNHVMARDPPALVQNAKSSLDLSHPYTHIHQTRISQASCKVQAEPQAPATAATSPWQIRGLSTHLWQCLGSYTCRAKGTGISGIMTPHASWYLNRLRQDPVSDTDALARSGKLRLHQACLVGTTMLRGGTHCQSRAWTAKPPFICERALRLPYVPMLKEKGHRRCYDKEPQTSQRQRYAERRGHALQGLAICKRKKDIILQKTAPVISIVVTHPCVYAHRRSTAEGPGLLRLLVTI